MDGVVLNADSMMLPLKTAPELRERYERFCEAINSKHPGNIYDEAKAFLECIFRTIITNRVGQVDEAGDRATFISLFDQAWDSLGIDRGEFKAIVRKSAKLVSSFRNNYGAVSHGQDGYEERQLDEQEALFVARESLSVAAFFYGQHLRVGADGQNERINYEDNPEFNEFIDSQEDCEILGISFLASEVLFMNDLIAYKERLIEYQNDSESQYYQDIYLNNESDRVRGK